MSPSQGVACTYNRLMFRIHSLVDEAVMNGICIMAIKIFDLENEETS